MRDILLAVLKTSSGSFFSLLFGIIKTKIIALFLGPSGIGLYSLLRQTLQTTITLTTFSGGTALVQGLSSKTGKAREGYLITVARILAVSGTGITIAFLFFAPYIAKLIFAKQGPQFVSLIRWLSIPVLFSSANAYVMGVLNGYRAIGRMAITQVAGAFVSALVIYPLVKLGRPEIFVVLLSITSGISLLVSTHFALRAGWLHPLRRWLHDPWEREHVRHFFSIALTTLVTGFAAMGSLLAIRAMFVRYGGLSSAGIFDVAWTLSSAYVMLALASFGTYYLPTLSGTKDPVMQVALIRRFLRATIMLSIPLIVGVIVFKPLLIHLLYSEEFRPALTIIRWMLIGDYLKITSWVLAMPMLAYADMKVFFWTEIAWRGAFTGIVAWSLFQWKDIQGVGIGFLGLYAVYLLYVLHYCRSRHALTLNRRIIGLWLAGLVIILGASVTYWQKMTFSIGPGMGWIGAAGIVSLLGLNREERRRVLRWIQATMR
jgi:O-antigen/teichoic acid export membrane protein